MSALGEFLLGLIGTNNYFEYYIYKTKEELADVYASRLDWQRASLTLASINFDSPVLNYKVDDKIDKYVTTAEYYHSAGDSTMSETYVRKCSPLVYENLEKGLRLRYELAFAKSQDVNRKF